MNKKYFLRILLNAASIYVAILASWYVINLFLGVPLDGEGGASLGAVYGPAVTLLILVILYVISILDSAITKPAFVILATVIAELATLLRVSPSDIISIENILLTHFIVLIVVSAGWILLRKYLISSN